MAPSNQVNVQLLSEVSHYVLIESITDASFTILVVLELVLLRVGPEQVAQQSLVWDVGGPFDHLYVSVLVQLLTQAAVHA